MTDQRKVLLVASEDRHVVQVFEHVLSDSSYELLVEKNKLQSVWEILENHVACIVMDLQPLDEENAAYINIIKKIRPRLPIVIISSEERYSSATMVEEFGVFYRTFKPLRIEEIEQLMAGVDRIIQRNQDYLIASL
ncbi:response regulator [candidate division KSB1 bacterium]|nr:response regulator [candidate division KSB1 bacterium]